jgi:hypothetical protein
VNKENKDTLFQGKPGRSILKILSSSCSKYKASAFFYLIAGVPHS